MPTTKQEKLQKGVRVAKFDFTKTFKNPNTQTNNFIYTKRCRYKKIYDEVTEDIFDMSNMRFLKAIEKRKNGDVYTLLCLRSAELSKVFGLRNLCYSKKPGLMLLGYIIAGISQKLEPKRKTNMPCAHTLHI